jgi:hypothetical protein
MFTQEYVKGTNHLVKWEGVYHRVQAAAFFDNNIDVDINTDCGWKLGVRDNEFYRNVLNINSLVVCPICFPFEERMRAAIALAATKQL